MRIGIANDLPIAVEALKRALAQTPLHQVIWVAQNGQDAVRACAAQRPDLILMDLLMSLMDEATYVQQRADVLIQRLAEALTELANHLPEEDEPVSGA